MSAAALPFPSTLMFLSHSASTSIVNYIRNMRLFAVIKVIVVAGITCSTLLSQTSNSNTLATPFAVPTAAPLNTKFVQYLEKEVRARTSPDALGGSHTLGLAPTTIDFSYLQQQTTVAAARQLAAAPARYDLRELGKVTPVRNQGMCGVCWAFASFGSLESALMPDKTWNLSENNLKNLHGFDRCPCDPACSGGNWQMAAAYLTRWSGPVGESADPYQQTNINSSPPGLPAEKHVQDIVMIPGRQNAIDNANLKNAVMSYGGVYTTLYMDEGARYYNAATAAYYYMGAGGTNHAVTLVGWDDTYPAANFAILPPGNGAFLIKNSWDTSFGQQGYFWVSYYDTEFAYDSSAAFSGPEPLTNYTRLYEYDPLGWVQTWGYGVPTAWVANIFSGVANEHIIAISTYFASISSSYIISVYLDASSGPTSGTLAGTTTGTVSAAGYHTIKLASPIPILAGQKFSVVMSLTTPGYNYPMPTEEAAGGYSSQAIASPGQSYFSPDGTSWADTTIYKSTVNVALKAFASDAPFSISATPSSGSGRAQVFSFRYTDVNGAAHINSTRAVFNSVVSTGSGCAVKFIRSAGTIALANDNGVGWGTPGVLGTQQGIENSQCSVDVGESSVAASGNDLTLRLSVTFKPTFLGAKNIYTWVDNTAGRTLGWQTRGSWTVTAPLEANLTFAPQLVKTTSPPHVLTLTNPAAVAMPISGISITGTNVTNFAQTNDCGTGLAPRLTCTISVTLTPKAPVQLSALLMIGGVQRLTLNGSGITPIRALSATALTFPPQLVGTMSAPKAITMSNAGTSALSITSIAIGGANNTNFVQTNDCGDSLAPGVTCTINVTLRPKAPVPLSANLMIRDWLGSGTVSLSGSGIQPKVSFSPTSLTFAPQPVGTMSAPQAIMVSNSGNAALSITSIAIGGTNNTNFAQTNDCGPALEAGSSCTISVTMKPRAPVPLSANVTVRDSLGTQTVMLAGSGT